MHFEVSARTILQLGRELISSDGVAFYELIKNAFDAQEVELGNAKRVSTQNTTARLKEVWVKVSVRIPYAVVTKARKNLADLSLDRTSLGAFGRELAANVDLSVEGAEELVKDLTNATSIAALNKALDNAAAIEFEDFGEGMTPQTLKSVYLLIGTPSRLNQQAASEEHIFLGEKGIGRLSTMRLGDQLFLATGTTRERSWNTLEIDWRECEKKAKLEDVNVRIEVGAEKPASASGTRIVISALRAEWTEDKLRNIARTDLSRFIDPFASNTSSKVHLTFNQESVGIEPLNQLLFAEAHAFVTGGLKFESSGKRTKPKFWADIDFRQYDRFEEVVIEGLDLVNFANADSLEEIEKLGEFGFQFSWFNRQALSAVEAIGTKKDVLNLVKRWSGGLMVYRDGFRVPPYGGHDDDWLGIDRVALSSGGYKVNRAQLVGKIDITKRGNPLLLDQTNREGLQDNSEKQILVQLMFKLLMKVFKPFMDTVVEEYNLQNVPPVSELKLRFEDQKKRLKASVRALNIIAADNPELELVGLASNFSTIASQVSRTIKAVTDAQNDVEARSKRFIDLAGLGLLADIIAHDLNVSLTHSLKKIEDARRRTSDRSLISTLTSANAQLKTLQKRVKILDKWAISGRQRKSKVSVYEVAKTVFEGRAEQFAELGIDVSISDSVAVQSVRISFVEGMLYQILENLTENSVYWLKERIKDLEKTERSFKPRIDIKIDAESGLLFFSDNGPGVAPENAKRIFGHAFSLKRNSEGKGLGLYISQELAKDQGASLEISMSSTRPDKRLNKFVFDFSEIVVK